MIYRTQKDYHNFKCIADKCPKSCCIGWQIMIDENSIDKYLNTTGDFADRLKSSIDYQENCFLQNNHRCSMLNDNGLCDLHSTLGEEYLCDTCRLYPRHIEEFQDIREYSLSLSCPEATRMLLEKGYDFYIDEAEDDKLDNPDEFEDFDFIIFDKLEYARDKMLKVAGDKSIPLQKRMDYIATAALKLQELYDEGDIFEMDSVSYDDDSLCLSFDYCLNSMDVLIEMEALEDSWTKSIKEAKNYWRALSSESSQWKQAMYPDKDLEFVFEKVLKCLLFSYFCGAVYDGQIYARAMIAVQSTRWLMMLYNSSTNQPLNSTIYLYSREVEHSDVNVNTLISFFEDEL